MKTLEVGGVGEGCAMKNPRSLRERYAVEHEKDARAGLIEKVTLKSADRRGKGMESNDSCGKLLLGTCRQTSEAWHDATCRCLSRCRAPYIRLMTLCILDNLVAREQSITREC